MARIIAFDVNETLLDLRALDPDFIHIFSEAAARREWFSQIIVGVRMMSKNWLA